MRCSGPVVWAGSGRWSVPAGPGRGGGKGRKGGGRLGRVSLGVVLWDCCAPEGEGEVALQVGRGGVVVHVVVVHVVW